MTNQPGVIVTARRAGISGGVDNELEILIRIQAPDAEPADTESNRPALNLALVLDRSGSMTGRPLEEAKRCAAYMIDGLRSADRAALVIYDDQVEVLVPSTPVLDKNRFKLALRGITERGSTNLHEGWRRGAQEAADYVDNKIVSRVLLLSDGCANQGVTDERTIFDQCLQLAEAGVSTSTYGLGGHFNERLMIGMAEAGQGRSYYSETADDLIDKFREEFALLRAICARNLRLYINLPFRGRVKVLNRYPAHPHGGCRLPDLAYSSEAWAVAQITIPKALTGGGDGRPVAIAGFQVDYLDRHGQRQELAVPGLELPSLNAAAFSALPEDELVNRRLGELEAAAIQERATAAALRGNWAEVDRILAEAVPLEQSNPWLQEIFRNLKELAARFEQEIFTKESLFQAQQMRDRLAAKKEDLALQESKVAEYIRRKSRIGKS